MEPTSESVTHAGQGTACSRCGDFGELTQFGAHPICAGCLARMPMRAETGFGFGTTLKETLAVSARIWPAGLYLSLFKFLAFPVVAHRTCSRCS